jgi:hypothetical protein
MHTTAAISMVLLVTSAAPAQEKPAVGLTRHRSRAPRSTFVIPSENSAQRVIPAVSISERVAGYAAREVAVPVKAKNTFARRRTHADIDPSAYPD